MGHTFGNEQAIVNNMLQATKVFEGAESSSFVADGYALGFVDFSSASSILQSDSIAVAIEGNIQWNDNDLSHLANDRGHEHALSEGFRRYRKGVLNKLSGSFSLAIIKPNERYALLAVDRKGIRPMAYSATNDGLIFGSYTDQISTHPKFTAEINPQSLFNYLYFHMVPSPGSIFNSIEKLQPGECIEFQNGEISRRFYWEISYSEERISESSLAAEFRNVLNESVRSCLSDKSTGTFLSGGLDSSTVTGVYQSLSTEKIDAFAIGFDAEGFDEMEFARASAKHFGVSLHEYYVTPKDVLDSIPLIASAYDEPFGNASAIPAYYCAKFARDSGKECLLAGDGGDEIFAGNARYVKQMIFDLYRHIPTFLKKTLIEPAAFHIPPLKKLKSYIEQAAIPMPERMETYNFLHRSPLNEIFNTDFLSRIDPAYPLNNLQTIYNRASGHSLVKRMLFIDQIITLADNDLRKVNRMCDLAGIDVRYPLLQDNMIDFSARVPSNLLIRRYQLRSFFRRAMKDFLAPETLAKSKHGFGLPFGLWLEEDPQLKEFADDNLQKIRHRGILNENYIDKIIHAHKTGHASYYGVMIWVLVMLEQWMQSHKTG
jgi:asparagine synthase (glutamine-hydrolysing)